ncbi:MAG: alpha/beta hydrolase [Frankiales bacterium]|nr:alpha/beta hydrolase [Frankiales bacterium]
MSDYRFAPELAAVVPTLQPLDLTDLTTTRAVMREAFTTNGADTTGLVVEERTVPGWPGDPDVGIRIVRPDRMETSCAGLFHVHGGGFVLGDLENSHARLCRLARELAAVTISVDYRLAPEHQYPAALHDVLAALAWVGGHLDELGIDRDRLAIHGISAGAGLAAATALHVRDHGGPRLCFQFLSIPELDDRLETESMRRFGDTPVWDSAKAQLSWDAYVGTGVPGTAAVSPYAAPARAEDLRGLPPAYINVMEFDPLRDEGVAYAVALAAAGVSVELHLFPGTYHGSSNIGDAPVTRREMAEEVAVLRAALSG